METIAIIAGAGAGRRMGADRAKQFLTLGGRPILAHALAAAEKAASIDGIVVVCPAGQEDAVRGQCIAPLGLTKIKALTAGGKLRQDSVAAGLSQALALGAKWVVIHDGVRPFAPPELFDQVLDAAKTFGAAVAACPAVDTIKRSGEDEMVQCTEDRATLWQVQTPQAFDAALLDQAMQKAMDQGLEVTDEAGFMEAMGHQVKLVMGRRDNMKITTPEDLRMARALGGGLSQRVGHGTDYHALMPHYSLILGGVKINHGMGLLGHSDADVLTHAVMDALLAAAGMGDIGRMFPDSDPQYKGISSIELLRRVRLALIKEGWRPAQVTVQLVAQAPKIAPYAQAMRQNLAQAMGIEPGDVNVAATTTEGLGPMGRFEGMSATAMAVIVPAETF